MSDNLPTQSGDTDISSIDTEDFVSMSINNQLFGIPVLTVQDVLSPQNITRIPLAPPDVAGALNLRGRIVTAIDVRKRLGMPDRDPSERGMNVVVEHGGELYSFIIDVVGEVLSLPKSSFEKTPATLEPVWREVSCGVYPLEDQLLVVLDVERLLDQKNEAA